MATPTVVPDVAVYQGDTCVFSYTLESGGVPRDLSGWTFVAQWRTDRDAADSLSISVDASSASVGRITLTLSAAQTAGIWGPGVWDLQGTEISSGRIMTFITGKTTFSRDVSRV